MLVNAQHSSFLDLCPKMSHKLEIQKKREYILMWRNNRMIILNNKIDIIGLDTEISIIEEKFEKGADILYVVDSCQKYLGCITRKEMIKGLQEKKLIVNYDSIKMQCGEHEKERASSIFSAHHYIYNIPVIDENGLLLYEYIHELDSEKFNSIQYWEERYKSGGNSGMGSYNDLSEFKAYILNEFIIKNNISSIIEWGFGDGNQLTLLNIPVYTGYDVSKTAWSMCKERYKDDFSKEFRYYDGGKIDISEEYDMSISLDVLYHLVEDNIYRDYMYNLFRSSGKYVCIYSSDYKERYRGRHVRRRKFTEYIQNEFPEWEMILFINNPYLYNGSNSNFYFYKNTLNVF